MSDRAAGDVLTVRVADTELVFRRADLVFLAQGLSDVFGQKNNKSVRETLAHRRYEKLEALLDDGLRAYIDQPLGEFLIGLKRAGNSIYKRFLNAYGDAVYCRFRMERGESSSKKGLYCYCVDQEIRYVGRSLDPFEKRINQGYGTIHPKNCYLDGQATNCHLNALIEPDAGAVSLFLCPMDDDAEIVQLERRLIRDLRPKWNIALKR